MSHLPQLETLLIDPPPRRRRPRRGRRGAGPALVVLGIVGPPVALAPRVGREAPDREIPAKTPTPAPTVTTSARAADFYSVLKRPAQPNDQLDGMFDARQ